MSTCKLSLETPKEFTHRGKCKQLAIAGVILEPLRVVIKKRIWFKNETSLVHCIE